MRTIQRIENGETEPRGDSLKRLAHAFKVSADEIVDWNVEEDTGFLTSLNLSALSFMLLPLLGVLIPLIIWISKKDKIRKINETSKELLNFQITWSLLFFLGYFGITMITVYKLKSTGDINVAFLNSQIMLNLFFIGLMYLYNFRIVIVNSFRIHHNKSVAYYPNIRFLRK